MVPHQEDSDNAESQIVIHSVVGSSSKKLKSSKTSSRTSDQSRKAKADLLIVKLGKESAKAPGDGM